MLSLNRLSFLWLSAILLTPVFSQAQDIEELLGLEAGDYIIGSPDYSPDDPIDFSQNGLIEFMGLDPEDFAGLSDEESQDEFLVQISAQLLSATFPAMIYFGEMDRNLSDQENFDLLAFTALTQESLPEELSESLRIRIYNEAAQTLRSQGLLVSNISEERFRELKESPQESYLPTGSVNRAFNLPQHLMDGALFEQEVVGRSDLLTFLANGEIGTVHWILPSGMFFFDLIDHVIHVRTDGYIGVGSLVEVVDPDFFPGYARVRVRYAMDQIPIRGSVVVEAGAEVIVAKNGLASGFPAEYPVWLYFAMAEGFENRPNLVHFGNTDSTDLSYRIYVTDRDELELQRKGWREQHEWDQGQLVGADRDLYNQADMAFYLAIEDAKKRYGPLVTEIPSETLLEASSAGIASERLRQNNYLTVTLDDHFYVESVSLEGQFSEECSNLGEAASCGSFSGTALLEAAHAREYGEKVDLSEMWVLHHRAEDFLDIDWQPLNGITPADGLRGHSVLRIAKQHGVCSEAAYPFQANSRVGRLITGDFATSEEAIEYFEAGFLDLGLRSNEACIEEANALAPKVAGFLHGCLAKPSADLIVEMLESGIPVEIATKPPATSEIIEVLPGLAAETLVDQRFEDMNVLVGFNRNRSQFFQRDSSNPDQRLLSYNRFQDFNLGTGRMADRRFTGEACFILTPSDLDRLCFNPLRTPEAVKPFCEVRS